MTEAHNSEQPEREEQKPAPKPAEQTENAGSGAGKPPRPTAIGASGTGDDDDKDESEAGRMRRYELDSQNVEKLDWKRLEGHPVHGLKFVRLDGDSRHKPKDYADKEVAESPTGRIQEEELADCINRTESTLDELHGKGAILAFLMHGTKTECTEYFGVSIAQNTNDTIRELEILTQALVKPEVNEPGGQETSALPLLCSAEIYDLIEPDCVYSSLVTGLPYWVAFKEGRNLHRGQNKTVFTAFSTLKRIRAGLIGHQFGLLALAMPYSEVARAAEELALKKTIEEATLNENPEFKRRLKYHLASQEHYLKMFERAEHGGLWSVCCYAFSRDASVSCRLMSLLTAFISVQDQAAVTNRPRQDFTLAKNIQQFSIIQARAAAQGAGAYQDYPFLVPLSSRELTAYFPLYAE